MHYNASWTWFSLGCAVLGIATPLITAYVPCLFATDIYSEGDPDVRSAFLALFWTLPVFFLLQLVFYAVCLATPSRWPLTKEFLWTDVLNPAAAAIMAVFLVKYNAGSAAPDLQRTLITMLGS